MLVDTAHSFGLSIFVFRILPKVDVARAIIMMNAVCCIPGLLKLILGKTDLSTCKRLACFIVDFLALIMQCTVFGIVLASVFIQSVPSTTSMSSLESVKTNDGFQSIMTNTAMNPFDMMNADEGVEHEIRKRNATHLLASSISRSIRMSDLSIDDLFDNPGAIPTPSVSDSPQAHRALSNLHAILKSFKIEWELPIALLLVSLVWWENFIDRDVKLCKLKLVNMKTFRELVNATRCKTNLFTSIWKIALTVMLAYMFHPDIFDFAKIFKMPDDGVVDNRLMHAYDSANTLWGEPVDNFNRMTNNLGAILPDQTNKNFPMPPPIVPNLAKRAIFAGNQTNDMDFAFQVNHTNVHKQQMNMFTVPQMMLPSLTAHDMAENQYGPDAGLSNNNQRDTSFKENWLTYLIPMLVQIACSGICYYTGRLACKLCMQRIGFALPLTLATPITLFLALIICKWFPNKAILTEQFVFWTCHEGYQMGSFKWQLVCGLCLWWTSQLWIGGHIWFAKSQKLAFTER
jgi:hypothetical protein